MIAEGRLSDDRRDADAPPIDKQQLKQQRTGGTPMLPWFTEYTLTHAW